MAGVVFPSRARLNSLHTDDKSSAPVRDTHMNDTHGARTDPTEDAVDHSVMVNVQTLSKKRRSVVGTASSLWLPGVSAGDPLV